MRHRVKGKKFSRSTSSRTTMIRGLVKGLVENDKVETTLAKAKYVRPKVEKFVTMARKGSLSSRRLLISRLGGDIKTAAKLVDDVGARFKGRPGGYTRIQRSKVRKGDNTQMAVISFVVAPKKVKKEIKKGGRKVSKAGVKSGASKKSGKEEDMKEDQKVANRGKKLSVKVKGEGEK